jgi:predicted dinucleotide-binding enzyme
MKIGIIGAGAIGSTLARKFVAAGHEVLLANSRDPGSLWSLAAELGARAVTAHEAALGVDAVVLSIPQGHVANLSKDLFSDLPLDAPVIDTGNYYPGVRDEPIPPIDAGLPESRWVADQIGRPVVKAFNSILAQSLAEKGREPAHPDRIALPVAGDAADGKRKVVALVSDAGFDAIDAGGLGESWRQQPGTPAYCTDLDAEALRRAIETADKARAPGKRDLAMRKFAEAASPVSNEDVVRLNRTLF